jgi:puromycin-sensitive aminopeptidase
MTSTNEWKLPTNIRPTLYTLTLEPDLENFTFTGSETIAIEVDEPASLIAMNSSEIAIQSATLSLPDGSESQPESITFDEEKETVTLAFAETVPAGTAELAIEFTGELNDKLRGFYRSSYTDVDGNQRWMATTQFEATDARRAFPCWDEPAVKAAFDITLVVPQELEAISNTEPVSITDTDDGKKVVHYAETPVMSTYLLAFIVGDLACVQDRTRDGVLMRVWATRGNEDKGQYALETSMALLDYFHDYFGVPYPLSKLDHIAIPDFAAGAMENWGAITYREVALLVDPVDSSAGTREIVAAIISHEMAHQWFGDLVTMEWWDDLWLNESFATWVGTKAVDWLFPEWSMWTQFVNMDTNRAFNLDGLKNSHPIEQEVLNPAEVSQLFDAISYSKGGSVLRMLEHFLTPSVFREGLNVYLNRHSYQNARTTDLWTALEESSGQPVNTIMGSWTGQMGYPVLDVAASPTEGGLALEVNQERFVFDSVLGDSSDDDEEQVWPVPLTVTAEGAGLTATLVNAATGTVTVATPSDPDWFKVNPDQTGFYRVNYTDEDWDRLVPVIENQVLPATDRLGIQNDAYALAKAGLLPVTRFLTLAEAYQNEIDASVWSDLATNLREIEGLIADEPYLESFRSFGRQLFAPSAQRSGWEPRPGEGHLDSLLRSTVLSQAGVYGDPTVIGQAQELFASYQVDAANVRPDLRGVVFSLVAQEGDRAVYDRIWELERAAELHEEKIRLLMSLARFQQEDLLTETLERSLSDDVRLQDTIFVVSAVAANNRGRDLAWEFLKDQWDEFDRRYGGGGFGLMRLVAITNSFTTNEKRDDVAAFFEDHPTPAAERTIRQALERIALNVAWLDRNGEELARHFG